MILLIIWCAILIFLYSKAHKIGPDNPPDYRYGQIEGSCITLLIIIGIMILGDF